MKQLLAAVLLVGAAYAQERDLTGYTLVFADEFNDLSLGTHRNKGANRWGDWPPYGAAGAFSFSHWAEIDRMGRDWHTVSSGILSLWMSYEADWADPNRKWISGLMASKDINNSGFAQRFGYWSARIKMPNASQGAWCAFWLASTSGIPRGGSKGYEIDIVEWYGVHADPNVYGWAIHPWNTDGSQGAGEGGSFVNIPGGNSTDWHVYGCEVNAENIVMYIDGQEVGRRPTNHDYLQEPLYIMLNYALRNDHSGQPFASRGSSAMQVDWVRAYSLPVELPVPTNLRVTGP